VGGTAAV